MPLNKPVPELLVAALTAVPLTFAVPEPPCKFATLARSAIAVSFKYTPDKPPTIPLTSPAEIKS